MRPVKNLGPLDPIMPNKKFRGGVDVGNTPGVPPPTPPDEYFVDWRGLSSYPPNWGLGGGMEPSHFQSYGITGDGPRGSVTDVHDATPPGGSTGFPDYLAVDMLSVAFTCGSVATGQGVGLNVSFITYDNWFVTNGVFGYWMGINCTPSRGGSGINQNDGFMTITTQFGGSYNADVVVPMPAVNSGVKQLWCGVNFSSAGVEFWLTNEDTTIVSGTDATPIELPPYLDFDQFIRMDGANDYVVAHAAGDMAYDLTTIQDAWRLMGWPG